MKYIALLLMLGCGHQSDAYRNQDILICEARNTVLAAAKKACVVNSDVCKKLNETDYEECE